jgi:hypothetical protein
MVYFERDHRHGYVLARRTGYPPDEIRVLGGTDLRAEDATHALGYFTEVVKKRGVPAGSMVNGCNR